MMRRNKAALVGRSMVTVGLASVLAFGLLPAGAHAEVAAAPAESVAASAEGDITVGHARNQVTGDVLGLGYEQVIRFDGPDVIITEPVARGGAELRRIPAQANSSWPDADEAGSPYTGQNNLVWFVKHEASRIAVLGRHVFVSRLLKRDGVRGAEVAKYSADGVLQTTRWISGAAITALDGYEHGGREYLAVGLSQYGVRVLRADEPGLTGFREVHTDWIGHGIKRYGFNKVLFYSDMVIAVRLGTDATGRLVLVSGRLAVDAHAIVATDLRAGEADGAEAAPLWEYSKRGEPASWTGYDADWEFPDLIDVGRLGSERRPLVAVSWPRTGRVSVVDAETGAEWVSRTASTGAHALRFFEAGGTGYVLIVRDAANGAESFEIGTQGDQGEWITVREGAKADLPAVLAELAGA